MRQDIGLTDEKRTVGLGELRRRKNIWIDFYIPIELFSWSLVLYLVLFLLENFFSGVVNQEFSINYFLAPILFFGLGAALFPKKISKKDNQEFSFRKTWWWLLLIAIIGGGFFYIKVGMESNWRILSTLLVVGLILITSLLLVIPEEYKFPKFGRNKYLLLLPIIAVLVLGEIIFWQEKGKGILTKKQTTEKYQITLINRNSNKSYAETYEKLLKNNGYENIKVSDRYNEAETSSPVTVMYSPENRVIGDEIAELLALSFGNVQKSPLLSKNTQEIIIILK